MTDRPALGILATDTADIVNAFVTGLQVGRDRRDADILKRQFAADVIWGGPFGALVNGYDQLHPIHVRLQAESHGGTPFHYVARHMLRVSDDVVIAHTARVAVGPNGYPLPPTDLRDQPFSEMAMYVLVRRNGQWWLAAGQNTPIPDGWRRPRNHLSRGQATLC
jgi:uncharacterized protein (TIGR02246 family)